VVEAEFWPETDAELVPVLAELRDREPIFHRPEFGSNLADVEQQMAPDFWEVGASGRRYSRDHVVAVLRERLASGREDPWTTSGFHCNRLGSDTYLLTYTLRQQDRVTRRVTVWRRVAPGRWQALFHQGTPVTG